MYSAESRDLKSVVVFCELSAKLWGCGSLEMINNSNTNNQTLKA